MTKNRQNNSLKQIYSIFEEISKNHHQINDFGKGDIFRINGEYKLKHPTLWVDIRPSSSTQSTITLNFIVYVMDIVDQSDYSEEDIHSETLFIINDVIRLLKYQYKIIEQQYNIQTTPFTQKFNDRVAGWYMDIQIRIPSKYGICDIPSDLIITESGTVIPESTVATEILQWNEAYQERITDISGSGNHSITLIKPNNDDLILDLSHTHVTYPESINELSDISGLTEIDLNLGSVIKGNLTNPIELSFQNLPAVGKTISFVLEFTGVHEITYPVGTKFVGGEPPDITGPEYQLSCSIESDGTLTIYGVIDEIS